MEESQNAILLTEEVLLEALCFDFIVASPHSDLVDLFDARPETVEVEEYAWSIANDSYVELNILFASSLKALQVPDTTLCPLYLESDCSGMLYPCPAIRRGSQFLFIGCKDLLASSLGIPANATFSQAIISGVHPVRHGIFQVQRDGIGLTVRYCLCLYLSPYCETEIAM